LRPSFGRISTGGVFPLSWSLDTVGPLAGSVADARVGWHVLTGSAQESGRPPSALRVGVPTGGWFDRVDRSVGAPVEELIERLAARGAMVRRVPVPDAEDLTHIYAAVQAPEAVSIHRDRMAGAPDLFEPETLDRLREAERVPAWDYARSLRRLGELRARAVYRLADLDVLVLPTVPIRAPLLGERDADPGTGWPSVRAALLGFTSPWSVLGLPAVSVPLAGSGSGSGLPVGAQLVGLPGGDEELLDAADSVERLR
jgi:aspartyl-tRNA(Asn)/glutamyl-tRNA(Gln) amidotransferase subunit A